MGLFSFLTGKKNTSADEPATPPASKPIAKSAADFAYTALAIETASKSSKSICRIAFIAFDENGKEITHDSIYIKPAGKTFSFSNVNGITSADVADAPAFSEAWPRISPYIAGSTIAVHYSQFALKCLSACLSDAGINDISCNIIDTHQLGKSMFPRLGDYTLDSVSDKIEGHIVRPTDTLSKVQAIADIINYAAINRSRKIKSCTSKASLS